MVSPAQGHAAALTWNIFPPTADLVDTFRHLYPDAKGQFTYWSTRSGCVGSGVLSSFSIFGR